MSKAQIITVSGAIVLFLTLYFCFDTIPNKQKNLEKSRMMNIESTGISNLIKDAYTKIDAEQKSIIDAMNLDL